MPAAWFKDLIQSRQALSSTSSLIPHSCFSLARGEKSVTMQVRSFPNLFREDEG
jgi:hypothetical protein